MREYLFTDEEVRSARAEEGKADLLESAILKPYKRANSLVLNKKAAQEKEEAPDYQHEADIKMILKDLNLREEKLDMDVQINSFCCFRGTNSFKMRASLSQNLFYADETVGVSLFVDNANNSRKLKAITCVLM